MNIITVICIAVLCLVIGWFLGVKTTDKLEKTLENVEKGLEFVEEVGSLEMIEQTNLTYSFSHVLLLQNIEKGNLDEAKEYLVNSLSSDYLDYQIAIEDGVASEEQKSIIEQVDELAKDYASFKAVVDSAKE